MKTKNLFKKLMIPAAGLCVSVPAILASAEVTFAQTAQKSASEAVAWVESLEGSGIDFDGAYGNQCVDLIKAYYDYLGEAAPRGNANTYSYNALPDGWQRIEGATPQPGDILVYTGGAYGHVAIYTGDNESYHQNWNGAYVEKVTGDYRFGSMGYWGVIRPDFEDTDIYTAESEDTQANVTYTDYDGFVTDNYGYDRHPGYGPNPGNPPEGRPDRNRIPRY